MEGVAISQKMRKRLVISSFEGWRYYKYKGGRRVVISVSEESYSK